MDIKRILWLLLFTFITCVKGNATTPRGNATTRTPEINTTNTTCCKNDSSPAVQTTHSHGTDGAGVQRSHVKTPVQSQDKKNNCTNDNQSIAAKLGSILTFSLGFMSSAILLFSAVCTVIICQRIHNIRQKNKNKDCITLQAVKSHCDQMIQTEADEAADEQTPLQRQPADDITVTGPDGGEAKDNIIAQEKTAGAAKEVEYASIDYSLLQQRSDGDPKPQAVETDYAEIQFKKTGDNVETEASQDKAGEDSVRQNEVKGGGQEDVHEAGLHENGVDEVGGTKDVVVKNVESVSMEGSEIVSPDIEAQNLKAQNFVSQDLIIQDLNP